MNTATENPSPSHLRRITGMLSALLIIAGFIISLVTLHVKPQPEEFAKLTDVPRLLFNFFEVFGFTLLTSGIFSIFLQIPDWRNYFEERLKRIVLEQEYLNSLDPVSLSNLQIRTLKAYFKTTDIDKEGSFLKYFQENLNQYIRAPYRENVRTEISIIKGVKDGIWIHDRIFYNCRMVGDSIQDTVKWKPDKDEFLDVQLVEIVARRRASIHSPQSLARITKEKDHYTVKIGDSSKKLALADILKQGLIVPLKDFNEDGLYVDIMSKYKMERGKFSNWSMAHPTKNFHITVKYPEGWQIRFQPMVLHPEKTIYDTRPGFFSMQYNEWLLPFSGIVYSFVQK